jgi:hypothetical protein
LGVGIKKKKISFVKNYNILKISLLSGNDHFGEENLSKNEKRTYTVTCISPEGSVKIVDTKNFMQRVWKEEKSKEKLEKIIERKESWLEGRVKEAMENILHEKKYLNQMNFSEHFIERDVQNKPPTINYSFTVPGSNKLRLKKPFIRHDKLSDFDVQEQLNELNISKNMASASISDLKSAFRKSFIERIKEFEKGMK